MAEQNLLVNVPVQALGSVPKWFDLVLWTFESDARIYLFGARDTEIRNMKTGAQVPIARDNLLACFHSG